MKLVKSLLLGSAAGLAAVAGAQAADLPSKKAAPVEYVRVCSAHGAGFFYIPGSDTCIKIGGRVRYEYTYSQVYNRASSFTGTRALGRFELDARNSTEFGLLRAYTRVDFARRGGALATGTGGRLGNTITGTGPFAANSGMQNQIDISRAFIQLGGLTAGRISSFFDFYAADVEFVTVTANSSVVTQALAYTATFGSGFSGTISIEDGFERRNNIAWAGTGTSGAAIVGGIAGSAGTFANATGFNYYGWGGNAMPDIVANLRVDQSWGSAQLSGAVHQVRTVGGATAATAGSNVPGVATPGYGSDSAYGWALQAGVKVNLPMIAAGDSFTLQGAYSQGATAYTMSSLTQGAGSNAVGKLTVFTPDAVITGAPGSQNLSLVTQWNINAIMTHYWTPKWRQNVFASYLDTQIPSAAYNAAGGAIVTNSLVNSQYFGVGTNVIWTPVKGLDIGAELNYQQAMAKNNINPNVYKTYAVGGLVDQGSAVTTRLRIQRDF